MPQNFDVILKKLFQSLSTAGIRALTGVEVVQWLDKELPLVRNRRADMLGRSKDGSILHLEFDSKGSKDLPLHVATYNLDIWRSYGQPPKQIVLYIGRKRVPLLNQLVTPHMRFRYAVLDLRDVSGEEFLKSDSVDDQILSILMHLRSQRQAVRRILANVARLRETERVDALQKFLLLSGLRELEEIVLKEAASMPTHYDIMDNKVFGPRMRQARAEGIEIGLEQGLEQGLEKGLEQGLEQGLENGAKKGKQELLEKMLRLRFKRIPAWAKEQLQEASGEQLTAWSLRLLSANKIEEVFEQ